MCHFCTEFGGEKTHHADANKGINMDIANRIWYCDLGLLTKPDKAQCACHGNPQAAEVATAFCITMPQRFKNGTVRLPPPIPKIADATPTPPPAASCTGVEGNFLFGST